MTDDLVFYTRPHTRGAIIRWMLEELGQPYRTEVPELKSDAYRAINPMGKVPAIRHGDVVVTECAAICAYLADAFPQAGLAPPPGDPERAPYYRWMFFAAGPIEQAMTNKAMGFEVPPERRQMAGYGSMADVLSTIEQAVSRQDYIAGDTFTAADVYFGSSLIWGMRFGMMEKRPAFEAYTQRLEARPAAIRANELDEALAAEQEGRKS